MRIPAQLYHGHFISSKQIASRPNQSRSQHKHKHIALSRVDMSGHGVDAEGEEEEDRKPVIKPGVHVTLKVRNTDGHTVYRTMRRTEQLQGLMDFYYASVPAVQRGTGRFLYDGGRLRGWQTPAELQMEDGDEVDFFTELLGGGGTSALPKAERIMAAPRFVTLKVVDQEQRLVRRTIRMNAKLQIVMDAYYDEAGDVVKGTGSFWFENVRLRGERTPAYFKLDDGDAIDFFQPQLGGGIPA
ncbi:di-SUMO-like protein [Hordeum vulgare]|nr:di-SUMO-like protein [Hordeum vulgare]